MDPKLQIAAAVILPNIGGFINGRITFPQIPTWYAKLNKPSFRPPNWVFGPVWTSLYTAMGYASYLVYRDAGFGTGGGASSAGQVALGLYGAQLTLNMAWSPLFFHFHSFKWVSYC